MSFREAIIIEEDESCYDMTPSNDWIKIPPRNQKYLERQVRKAERKKEFHKLENELHSYIGTIDYNKYEECKEYCKFETRGQCTCKDIFTKLSILRDVLKNIRN